MHFDWTNLNLTIHLQSDPLIVIPSIVKFRATQNMRSHIDGIFLRIEEIAVIWALFESAYLCIFRVGSTYNAYFSILEPCIFAHNT